MLVEVLHFESRTTLIPFGKRCLDFLVPSLGNPLAAGTFPQPSLRYAIRDREIFLGPTSFERELIPRFLTVEHFATITSLSVCDHEGL